MRIIGGHLGGRIINLPSSYKARPTTDFAKEGLFNTLENMVDFESASVLDLFSGTGSLGYEFASRGCEDIVSVEMNPVNAGFIKGFVRKLGIRGMHVVHQNVFDFLKICHKKFDIVTADPPYDLEGLESIPEKILFEGSNIIKEGGYFILEHPSTFSFEDKPYFLKEKKYGKVHFSIFFFGK